MQNRAIIDIGTTKICTIILNSNKIKGLSIIPSKGLKKGKVVHIEKVSKQIDKSIAEAEKMAGVTVDNVYIGITGSHIKSVNSNGIVDIEGEVTPDDIERALDICKTYPHDGDKILHTIPSTFYVDNDEVDSPLDMACENRLEVIANIITASKRDLNNLNKAVNRLGIGVEDIILQPLASAKSVLTDTEKDLGVILVDIGGGTTDIAVFKKGNLVHSFSIEIGGEYITKSIMKELKRKYNIMLSFDNSEELKKRYNQEVEGDKISFNGLNKEKKIIEKQNLRKIIYEANLKIVERIKEKLENKMQESYYAQAGIVLTGGGSLTEGIESIYEEKFNLKTRLGRPRNFKEIKGYFKKEEDKQFQKPIFATALGLVKFAQEDFDYFEEENNNQNKIEKQEKGFLRKINQKVNLFLKEMKSLFSL